MVATNSKGLGGPVIVDDPRNIPEKDHYAIIWPVTVPTPGDGSELARALSYEVFPDKPSWEAAVREAHKGPRPFKAVGVMVYQTVTHVLPIGSESLNRRG